MNVRCEPDQREEINVEEDSRKKEEQKEQKHNKDKLTARSVVGPRHAYVPLLWRLIEAVGPDGGHKDVSSASLVGLGHDRMPLSGVFKTRIDKVSAGWAVKFKMWLAYHSDACSIIGSSGHVTGGLNASV